MSYPSHSSITTEQRLPLPLNGVIYTTVRPVATEKQMPVIGETMAAELGSAWATSRIISVQKAPSKGDQGKQLVIRHAIIPSEENQLSSNWEFSTCDMGGTRFPSVVRTVVLLGSAVAHDTPAKGGAMPFVTGDLFDGKGYIFVDRQVSRSGMELEPTFRVERRSYVIKSAMKNLGVDPLNGKMLTSETTLYYATETVIPGVTQPQTILVTGTLTPDATSTVNRVEDLNGFPQFSSAIDGGTFPATRLYHNGTSWILSHHTETSLTPYATWKSDACNIEECPNPADATGWTPLFGIGMADPTGTPVFTDDTEYSSDITGADLFADPNNAFWGLQADATQRTGQQLSCGWYSVTQETVVAGVVAGSVVEVDNYTTNDRFYWPPVLETYQLLNWVRRDGGVEIYPALRFHPDGYNGPCQNTITRTWSKTPFSGSSTPPMEVVDILKPTRIYYACPYYTVNISECLHDAVEFQCEIGNNDPVYDQNVNSTRHFAATNPDDGNTWPATLVAYDDQEPFRGGYLRTRKVVDRPAIPANVNWLTGAEI